MRRNAWRAPTSTSSIPSCRSRLAFRRTIARGASGAAVYFVHTSAREGVEAVVEARGRGLPIYAETLHQYACFTAEYYKKPRGFC